MKSIFRSFDENRFHGQSFAIGESFSRLITNFSSFGSDGLECIFGKLENAWQLNEGFWQVNFKTLRSAL